MNRGKDFMQAMVCELCGSNDIVKQDGVYVCQHCGTKYTVEEAKKLMGTVKIDKSEEVKKLLVLARRARNEGNSENAANYYGKILEEDPNNWEASFFQVYYQSTQCKIAEISSAASRLANCLDSSIALIKDIPDEKEKEEALNSVVDYSISLKNMLNVATRDFYFQHSTVSGTFERYCSDLSSISLILIFLETALKKHFPEKKELICKVQKDALNFLNDTIPPRHPSKASCNNIADRLLAEIKEVDKSYSKELDKTVKKGCYVATAVYGSYDCPEVWTLRRFRDGTLAGTWYGRAFIRTYYAISPTLVKWFGKAEWFKNLWKPTLDRMVVRLNGQGVANTPYVDRKW